jgi:anti-anti-sigma factor
LPEERARPQLASLACRVEGGLDRRRIRDLDRLVAPALKRDGVQVFVDLTGVTSMDSTGLAWLLRIQETLELRGGSLQVVAAGQEVLPKLLSLSGLDDQVVVFAPRLNAEQEITARAL